MIAIVTIETLDPLAYHADREPPFHGSLRIDLPELRYKLIDLSMGLPELDACIAAKGRALSWDVTGIERPGMSGEKLRETLEEAAPMLKELHQLYQKELDKLGFLLERSKL